MNALKNRFTEVVGVREFGGCDSATQAPYYLKHLEDNLFEPMSKRHAAAYGKGSGKELDSKMKALRSSSAMTFNLLGNGTVEIGDDGLVPAGTFTVEYEHQLPTLKRNPHPANVDAKLESLDGSCRVYCEMKMAEWIFGKACGLRQQYLMPENYLVPEDDARMFCNLLSKLTKEGGYANGRYQPLLDRYDALQMMKHAIGIYTDYHRTLEAGGKVPQKTVLVNCVWEMRDPGKLGSYEDRYLRLLEQKHEQFDRFVDIVQPEMTELFARGGTSFELCYYPFPNMLDLLNLEPKRKAYLERYIA
ncbi:MAG: hypothetical protein IJI68_13820 [Eggerthellaceae bacterium]|nr:hypothetical protein [Eggerthellaceae bacterium]